MVDAAASIIGKATSRSVSLHEINDPHFFCETCPKTAEKKEKNDDLPSITLCLLLFAHPAFPAYGLPMIDAAASIIGKGTSRGVSLDESENSHISLERSRHSLKNSLKNGQK